MQSSYDILNHPLIAERYFFPKSSACPRPTRIATSDGELLAHHAINDPSWPTLVHFHGNAESVSDYVPTMRHRFTDLGYNLFFVEYRGSGGSVLPPLLGNLLKDVVALRNALTDMGVPDGKVVVYGRSVGSLFALEWVSHFPQTAGLILESAIADVLERLLLRIDPADLGIDRLRMEKACDDLLNHERKLANYPHPVLILHAAMDHLVDVEQAQQLRKWCQSPASKLIVFHSGDHNSLYWNNRSAFEQAIIDYRNRLFADENSEQGG